jgi:hypothetical protein
MMISSEACRIKKREKFFVVSKKTPFFILI